MAAACIFPVNIASALIWIWHKLFSNLDFDLGMNVWLLDFAHSVGKWRNENVIVQFLFSSCIQNWTIFPYEIVIVFY